jgi:hypothetical protein
MTGLPDPVGDDSVSAHVEADARSLQARPDQAALLAQTLRQKGGYAITLLVLDGGDEDE